MESTKSLNNERRYSVAEFYLYIIISEWLIFIFIGLSEFSLVSEDFLEKNKWTSIGIATVIGFGLQLIISSVFRKKISDLKDKYSQIYNWKSTNYRKRALFYTIFYLVLFPFFLVGFYILLDLIY